MHSPLVSIIIPAYNVASYIGETLASVLSQTVHDFEIIVVNDGSSDHLERALEPYRGRIVYLSQENRGPGPARNTGLDRARGRYLALLDGDDLWLPSYLERMLPLLDNCDVAYPNAVLFGSPRDAGRRFLDICPSRRPVTYERLLERKCVVVVSAVFKRERVAWSGVRFDDSKRGSEDLEFWLRLARRGLRFDFTSEVLVKYRRRPGSYSGSKMSERDINVYERLMEEPETTRRQREIMSARIAELRALIAVASAKDMIRHGRYEAALSQLRLAAQTRSSFKLTAAATGLRLAPAAVSAYLKLTEARE